MKRISLYDVALILSRAMNRLKFIVSDFDAFSSHLYRYGYDVANLPPGFQALASNINSLQQIIEGMAYSNATPSDIINAFQAIRQIVADVDQLSAVPLGVSDNNFLQELPKIFLDSLVVEELSYSFPSLINTLTILGIIDNVYHAETPTRGSFYIKEFNVEALKDFIDSPTTYLKAVVNWGAGFAVEELLPIIQRLLAAVRIPSELRFEKFNNAFPTEVNGQSSSSSLSIFIANGLLAGQPFLVGAELRPLPVNSIELPGFAILPLLPAQLTGNLQIASGLTIGWSVSNNLPDVFGILIRPDTVKFIYPNTASAVPLEADLHLEIVYTPASNVTVVGQPQGTRIELGGIGVAIDAKYFDNANELVANISLKDFQLVIKPNPDDGFLSKILDGEKTFPIRLEVSWSTKSGLHFVGSGGFEVELSSHLSLGPISVENIKVSLYASTEDGGGVQLQVVCDIVATIGSLVVVVNNVGTAAALEFGSGNLGIADVSVALRPPSGAGISIDTATIQGGGFLNFDKAKSTYTGGLELTFSKISLKAIGILTTKLPDGEDGYSLLIIITAEFTPIQLGLGFTLNGVGGLLGLHRTINTDRLRSGIRDKTLDSILFPTDIVQNAGTIISNIGQVFPIKKDRFLIGPMAKIGWGTPTLLTIDLGIIIEVPSPILLAIVGVLKAKLPTEEKAVLKLQINFVGIIDFDKKYISFDAALYDSSILTFPLTGDMALRLYWGDKPNFLMTVGGFHPNYTPPPSLNLPPIQRLAIQLANDNNLNIRVEAYFAITSNTAQFGAKVSARAKAWIIEAVGTLGFDILFQFSPFAFIANMGATFDIRKKNDSLLTVYIDVTIEGPRPWRARGEGAFKVLGVRVRVPFDKTFGQAQAETIAPAAIHQLMVDAILNKENWQVTGPERSHQVVSFRDVSGATADNLVADPYGSLSFSQKVAPLGIKLTKFGTSAISDFNRFQITGVSAGASSPVNLPFTHTKDFFAPNSFFYLTDDEKLSKDGYEKFDSGVGIGNTSEIKADYFVHKPIAYDEIILDIRKRWKYGRANMTAADMALHSIDNYITKTRISDNRKNTPPGGPGRLFVKEHEFVIADKNSLAQVAGGLSFGSRTEADIYLQSLVGTPAYNDYMVVESSEI